MQYWTANRIEVLIFGVIYLSVWIGGYIVAKRQSNPRRRKEHPSDETSTT